MHSDVENPCYFSIFQDDRDSALHLSRYLYNSLF